MKSLLRKFHDLLFTGIARQSDILRLYDQISGLQQIQNAMTGKTVLRPMRGWAMSPDAIAWILADLQERKSPTIIEFGSGQSTVIFASLLRNRGSGRLISVEHDPEYASGIQRQLAACGLEKFVEFTILALEEAQTPGECESYRSYGVNRLPEIAIDLALIDGPPISNGATTRYVPLKWSIDHLASGGSIYLDDSKRDPEQEILSKICRIYDRINVRELVTEKGLALVTRR